MLQAGVRRVLLEILRLEIGKIRGNFQFPLQLHPLWILFRPAEDVWDNNSITVMRGLQTQIVIPRRLVVLCSFAWSLHCFTINV
jgi:hypothetical protein